MLTVPLLGEPRLCDKDRDINGKFDAYDAAVP